MLKINLILSSTNRSLIYLKELIKNNYRFNLVIFYSFKKNKRILNILKQKKINYKVFKTNEINELNIEKELSRSKNALNIFSGYPGQIIKSKKILKNMILHIHPGSLYDFKGSTTLYYSLIMKGTIYCSVIALNSKIDSGKVLFKKKLFMPKKITIKKFESSFENDLRALTLIEYLKLYSNKSPKINKRSYSTKSEISNYYICHPILRGLVFSKKFN